MSLLSFFQEVELGGPILIHTHLGIHSAWFVCDKGSSHTKPLHRHLHHRTVYWRASRVRDFPVEPDVFEALEAWKSLSIFLPPLFLLQIMGGIVPYGFSFKSKESFAMLPCACRMPCHMPHASHGKGPWAPPEAHGAARACDSCGNQA